jgi:hypothetical protein
VIQRFVDELARGAILTVTAFVLQIFQSFPHDITAPSF